MKIFGKMFESHVILWWHFGSESSHSQMTGLIYHRARTIKRMGPNHYDNVVFQRKSANETNDFFVLVHLNYNQIDIII